MLSSLSRTKTGFYIMLAHGMLATFAFSFIFLFFQQHGYSLEWIIASYVLSAAIAIILCSTVRTYSIKTFLMIGFAGFSFIAFNLWFYTQYSLFISAILLSIIIIFYWLPLNYLFFKSSSKLTGAMDSSFYMVFPSILGIIMPPLGAYVIKTLGYSWLFGLAAVLFPLCMFIVWKFIPQEIVHATPLRKGIKEYKGLPSISVLEGSLQFFTGLIIPVYALLFFEQAHEIGWFLSYTAIIGLIMAVVVAHFSDKTQQRKSYIMILFLLLTLSIFSLSFASTSWAWIIAIGLFSIIHYISLPLRLAVSMDAKTVDMTFWQVREIFLNIGRFITLSISAVLFYYRLYWPVFVMFGLIALIYPFLVNYKLEEIR